MKIIDYNKTFDKEEIAKKAYSISKSANFPVNYEDVYDHLFSNDEALLLLLINGDNNISGFSVFEKYELLQDNKLISMLYLSGMVIEPNYQGNNLSQEIIKQAHKKLKTDLISLRTQNIAMAKAMLNTFRDCLLKVPGCINEQVLSYLRHIRPFVDIDQTGVVKNCYYNQLYYNLNAIKEHFGITLESHDALAVLIEPNINKQKKKSIFE